MQEFVEALSRYNQALADFIDAEVEHRDEPEPIQEKPQEVDDAENSSSFQ